MRLRNLILILLLAAGAPLWAGQPVSPSDTLYKEGDIIFQSNSAGQGYAIQIATGSKYSHCGMLYKKAGKWYVLESVQPVVLTPLDNFINHGDGGHYVVKRLANRDKYITDSTLQLVYKEANKYIGKNYDLYFGWNDDLIYCSELVWKVYKQALNVELGTLQKLSEFNLSHPVVQAKLKERYGKNVPYDEKVISPARIFESKNLITVAEN